MVRNAKGTLKPVSHPRRRPRRMIPGHPWRTGGRRRRNHEALQEHATDSNRCSGHPTTDSGASRNADGGARFLHDCQRKDSGFHKLRPSSNTAPSRGQAARQGAS
uniref:Uncharacterized protein n=1 Tax=Setaria viridis TaxID=4556 RepID=A0A4U6UAZ2_SETVI|nr:hypothetical protein SEVIR_5G076450v2 [Setaria viridis]